MDLENELGRQLHDRATRGETMTAVEQDQLAAWYARQDVEEGALLAQQTAEAVLTPIEGEIAATLEKIAAVTRQIQVLSAANDHLRRENATLRSQLVSLTV